jgi:hypothetical protein
MPGAICDRVRPCCPGPGRVRAHGSGRPAVHRREVPADLVGRRGRLVSAGRAVLGCPMVASRVAADLWEPAAGHASARALPVSAPWADLPWARRIAAPGPERPAVASACPFPNCASCVPYGRRECVHASIHVPASGAPGNRSSNQAAPFGRRAGEQNGSRPIRCHSGEIDTNALPTDATTNPG